MKRLLIAALVPCSLAIGSAAVAAETNEEAIIPNGDDTSQVIDFRDKCATGLLLPADFTGTEITAEAAVGSATGTYGPLYQGDGTTEWVIPYNAGRAIDLTQLGKMICGFRFVKFVSDDTEGDDRSILIQLAGP